MRWTFRLSLDPKETTPLFLQIARAIAFDVRRGRLPPGTRLPGTRTLSESLAVHRNTVVHAYRELESEGWIETQEANGTFVSRSVPNIQPRRFSSAPPRGVPNEPVFGFVRSAHADTSTDSALLALSSGLPDPRLAPTTALARAYRRALEQRGRQVLTYGDPKGDLRLREAVATMLRDARGLAAQSSDIVITRGSQMALFLAASRLVRAGDAIAIEALGYRPAWEAFKRAGANLLPVPVDEEGLSMDALEKLLAETRIRALYVTPHHQYPTTVTLSASRRIRLLALARKHRFAILEDDYDHEFHYSGRPILPLASADESGVVVYIGTLSKILAPGLRLGYVVAPRTFVDAIADDRLIVDRQGDLAIESAIAELIEDGELQRHVRRAKRIYEQRREHALKAMARLLPSLHVHPAAGGMALWASVDSAIHVDRWSERAKQNGILVHAAKFFSFKLTSAPFFRIGFASLSEKELDRALRTLARSA